MPGHVFVVNAELGFFKRFVEQRSVAPALPVDGRARVEFFVVGEEGSAEGQFVLDQSLVEVQLAANAAEAVELRLQLPGVSIHDRPGQARIDGAGRSPDAEHHGVRPGGEGDAFQVVVVRTGVGREKLPGPARLANAAHPQVTFAASLGFHVVHKLGAILNVERVNGGRFDARETKLLHEIEGEDIDLGRQIGELRFEARAGQRFGRSPAGVVAGADLKRGQRDNLLVKRGG